MLAYIAQLATALIFLLGVVVIRLLRQVATQQTQAQEIAKLKAQLKEAHEEIIAKREMIWEIKKITQLPVDERQRGDGAGQAIKL